jgi:ubiquinone/menaquinone biosynthesis C-methylase UbiE
LNKGKSIMHEHRFHGEPARLRNPERLAWLEVERVVELSLIKDGNIHNVLDIGTGTGIFAESFLQSGLVVEGLDGSPEMLQSARDLVPGVIFQEGEAENLPYPDASFDLVFMGLLLHETDDQSRAMREAARVSRQRIAVLEWPYEIQEIGPGFDERLTNQQIIELASESGFVVTQTTRLNSLVLYILEKSRNQS